MVVPHWNQVTAVESQWTVLPHWSEAGRSGVGRVLVLEPGVAQGPATQGSSLK